MVQKAKLVYNSFVPSKGSYNFFYKPSKENNIIVYCSDSYGKKIESIYGEFPLRLNPIVLRLEVDGQTIVNDLLLDRYNTNILEDILNNNGDCEIEMKYYKKTIIPVIKDGHVILQPF